MDLTLENSMVKTEIVLSLYPSRCWGQVTTTRRRFADLKNKQHSFLLQNLK